MHESGLVFNAWSVEHPSLTRTGFTTDLEVAKAWVNKGALVCPLHTARWPDGNPFSPATQVESRSADERAAVFADVQAVVAKGFRAPAVDGVRTTAELDPTAALHLPVPSSAEVPAAVAVGPPSTEQTMTREQAIELVRLMQRQFLEVLRRAGVSGVGGPL